MRFFKKHIIITIVLIFLSVYLYMNFTRIVETNKLVDKSSPYYVNDLYASDGRIYENYLDVDEKKIYNKIVKHTKTYNNRFDLYYKDYNCKDVQDLSEKLFKVFDAVLIDHPEMMNYAGIQWRYDDATSDHIHVGLYFAFSNQFKEYIGQLRIQKIISDIKLATNGMSEQEKVKYVYDWMGEHARYDYTFQTFSKNQSIYNVFMKGNAVCAGFAKASQVIFQNIGIESYTITGNLDEGRHMWNIVKVDGKYYYYDSTVAVCRKKGSSGYNDGLNQEKFENYDEEMPEWYDKINIEKSGSLE